MTAYAGAKGIDALGHQSHAYSNFEEPPEEDMTTTDIIIEEHKFTMNEQWMVFLLTFLTSCSFYAVIAVLWKKHVGRGMDIVLIHTAALCFLMHRACIAFRINSLESAEYVFLPSDSWHKLSNIFMLIEYCSLIIYLAKLPHKLQGYVLAFGICIIVILQEKDSFSYQYALMPLIFNNLVLICSSVCYDKPGSFNPQMVFYGALWYAISVIGFLLTFSETLDYYFVFDDLFMASTAFSLFYSWQSYIVPGECAEKDGHEEDSKVLALTDAPFVFMEMLEHLMGEAMAFRQNAVTVIRQQSSQALVKRNKRKRKRTAKDKDDSDTTAPSKERAKSYDDEEHAHELTHLKPDEDTSFFNSADTTVSSAGAAQPTVAATIAKSQSGDSLIH